MIRHGLTTRAIFIAMNYTSWSGTRLRMQTTSTTKRRSRIQRSSPCHGRSTWFSIGTRRRVSSCWTTKAMALTMRSTTRSNLRGDAVARIQLWEGEFDMSIRLLRSAVAVSTLMAALLLTVTFVRGQEQAKAPWQQGLTADGQPDLQGFWSANPSGTYDITDPRPGGVRLDELLKVRAGEVRVPKPSRVVDPPDGKIPYQPWAAGKQKDLQAHVDDPTKPEHIDTQARCFLDGATRGFFHSGFEILQVPGYVIFLWEQNSEYRVIPLGGGPHLGSDIKLWQGDSRGHWDGNTLVIDITNLNA